MSNYGGTDVLENFTEAKNYNGNLLARVLRWAPPTKIKFFDFGAGIGTFAKSMRAKGYSITCIEPDDWHCTVLEKEGLSFSRSLMEIADENIEYIYSINVLEHIEDDQAVFNQMFSKISSGGRIYIFVPAFSILYSSFDKKIGHIRRYQRKELVSKIRKAGFNVESARYFDSIGFFVALLYRVLDNGKGQLKIKQLLFYDRIIFPISLIFDWFFANFFGKNIEVVAYKD